MKKPLDAARFRLSTITTMTPERERERVTSRIARETTPADRANLLAELLEQQQRTEADLEILRLRIALMQHASSTARANDRKAMDEPN